jgi:hypothetical protein
LIKRVSITTLNMLFVELKEKLDNKIALKYGVMHQDKGGLNDQGIKDLRNEERSDNLASIKSGVSTLEGSKLMISENDYQEKLETIKYLSCKLDEDEGIIHSQASELEALHDRSNQLTTTMIVLLEKIASVEREEKLEENYIGEQRSDISSLRDALKETIGHLKAVSDKNFDLEQQHRLDQQKMNETIAKMNTNLIGIAVLAKKYKEIENERNEETNRYLSLINQLNSDLIATEKRLKERTDALNVTQEADQEHQAQILRLSQRIAELDEEELGLTEKDENIAAELAKTKQELIEVIKKFNDDEIEKKLLQKALSEDRSRLKVFEDETIRYSNILSGLTNEIKEVKKAQGSDHLEEMNRYLSKLSCLSKMLRDTEEALLLKTRELNYEKEIEGLQDKHTKILFNKIEELKNIDATTGSALKAKNQELEFYKDLLRQATDKLGARFGPAEPQGSQHQPKSASRHGQLPSNMPPTLQSSDKAAVEQYLATIRHLDEQLRSRDALLKKEAARLHRLRQIKSCHAADIQRLWRALKDLQAHKFAGPAPEQDKLAQLDDLKRLLDEAGKKLVIAMDDNGDAGGQDERELAEIELAIAETSQKCLELARRHNTPEVLEERLQMQDGRDQGAMMRCESCWKPPRLS